jgi:glycosyltransferase involved in cell wall biosynthesis
MRVLHVAEPCTGGVMEWLRRTTLQQQELEHEVHLLAPPSFPALPGVNRHEWSIDRRHASTLVEAGWQLRRLVDAVRPEVLHLHSFLAGVLGRLPILMADQSLPVVYQPHAWSFNYYSDPHRASLVRRWERWADRFTTVLAINSVDELNEGRRAGITSPGLPLGVIVDLERFAPASPQARAQARQSLGLDGRKALIVIGRICRQKGQDRLVAAWEREPIEETSLFLIGPGNSGGLAHLAPTQWNRSIHAVGECSDVRQWLWAADMLVFPSRYEGLSLVMAEALACGLPVVSTAVGGAHETITDGWLGPAGAVVPIDDVSGLLKKIRDRLEDPTIRHQESIQARIRAEAFFDAHDFGKRLEAAYTLALTKQGNSKSLR